MFCTMSWSSTYMHDKLLGMLEGVNPICICLFHPTLLRAHILLLLGCTLKKSVWVHLHCIKARMGETTCGGDS